MDAYIYITKNYIINGTIFKIVIEIVRDQYCYFGKFILHLQIIIIFEIVLEI